MRLRASIVVLSILTSPCWSAPRSEQSPVRQNNSHLVTEDEFESLQYLLPMFQDLCSHSDFDHCDLSSPIIQMCEKIEKNDKNISTLLVQEALTLFFSYLHERKLNFIITPAEINELQRLCSTVLYRTPSIAMDPIKKGLEKIVKQ